MPSEHQNNRNTASLNPIFSHTYRKQLLASIVLFTIVGCSFRAKPENEVVYLIPQDFEGAVVIIYDQKDGDSPTVIGQKVIFDIPENGVLKVTTASKEARGRPEFLLVQKDGRRFEVELLVSFDPTGKYRTSKQVTEEERESTVFVNSYEQGNFSTTDGVVRFRNFRVGKDKDGNYNYTQMQMKITDIQKSFARD